MSEPVVHQIVEGRGDATEPEGGELVRRRIVAWRRLEPGDVRTPGSLNVPESPFLEARVFEIGVPRSVHEEMERLAKARASAVEIPRSPLSEYEPAGVLIAAAGGAAVGVWLEYLRPANVFLAGAAVVGVVGVLLASYAKSRRRALEEEAEARWSGAPEKKEYEELARRIAQGWLGFAQQLKKESGFHVEIRVAEGSNDPLRLASIDPRPMEGARGFDPQDWLPTEGGGVRYEALHAAGEIATRLLPGTTEVGETAKPAPEPPSDASAASERESAASDASEPASEASEASEPASEASDASEPATDPTDEPAPRVDP